MAFHIFFQKISKWHVLFQIFCTFENPYGWSLIAQSVNPRVCDFFEKNQFLILRLFFFHFANFRKFCRLSCQRSFWTPPSLIRNSTGKRTQLAWRHKFQFKLGNAISRRGLYEMISLFAVSLLILQVFSRNWRQTGDISKFGHN